MCKKVMCKVSPKCAFFLCLSNNSTCAETSARKYFLRVTLLSMCTFRIFISMFSMITATDRGTVNGLLYSMKVYFNPIDEKYFIFGIRRQFRVYFPCEFQRIGGFYMLVGYYPNTIISCNLS